ncbi:MAG: phage holin, partial [Lacrimispora sphenoides]
MTMLKRKVGKKMNLKLRLKNKATLLALLLCMVAFVYQVCGIIGVVPPVAQEDIVQLIGVVINLLVGLGVLIDPTTRGIADST